MPERWEHEIRKLRELLPREDLDARVAEGPRGEPSAPPRQRIFAAMTALAVFVAAGVLLLRVLDTGRGGSAPGQTGGGAGIDGSVVLELSSNDGAPNGTLRYGAFEQDGAVESYNWCPGDSCVGGSFDSAFYPPVPEFLVVPPGSPIEVAGDGMLASLRVLDQGGAPIAHEAGQAVPEADGRYVLEVSATWDQADQRGDAKIFFGVQTLSTPAAAPDVLQVDCSYGVARSDSAIVRTQGEGLHLVFVGTDGLEEFGIVTPEGTASEEFVGVGGRLPENGRTVMPVAPGRWEVGCGGQGRPVVAGDTTATFELVDPDDHYAPVDVTCSNPAEQSFSSAILVQVPHAEAAARLLIGLGPEDRLRGAGYGADTWILGPTYVVDRGGQAVAKLVLGLASTEWSGTLHACAGSGIAPAPPSATASPTPTSTEVFFPTWSSPDRPSAIVVGVLEELDRCLFLRSERALVLLLWEERYSYDGGTVLDSLGQPVARVGDTIRGGGGYGSDWDHAEQIAGQAIPDRCRPQGSEPYALIYDVRTLR